MKNAFAAFVREIAERHAGEPEFDMAMSRSDIAHYLGLIIETVARSLTKLRERRIIRLNGKLQ
ncbi:helix-turn-helix domain-containing protein [Rhizobium mongolense]|uniref:helix-turn-helix domain-containing protein n=1 Tax=Rhizobium TaxID=379 RepID=UPI0024858861|nr:helix-turn-helix domain-containing protein [Rhizobium sp. 007]